MTLTGEFTDAGTAPRFPGPKLLALLSVLVVVPVLVIGALITAVGVLIVSDDGLHATTALGVGVLLVLGWSPVIAGAVAWSVLRRKGNDGRGAWGGTIAVAAITFAAAPVLVFVFYVLAWAFGSAFLY